MTDSGETRVAAAQRGDVRAFEALYADVQPRVLRLLLVLLNGAHEDAADVSSETWLQVARDLHRFRGDDDAFRGWVAGIARHRALDHVRASGRRPSQPWDPALLPTPSGTSPGADRAADESLATRRALALIARLPQDQAEAVLLRVVVGLDAPAAAKVLGKRAGAVRMATSRGLARLEALLTDDEGPAPGVPAPRGVTPEPAPALEGSTW